MPTPPPWCSDTQVAPPPVASSALSSGQSDTASEPSIMLSVSRLGEATEPESRWSRPMTTGAFSSPLRTISLNARPARSRSPRPIQQVRVVREQLLHLRVGLADVLRITRQRHPAERALALAEERAHVGGHEAGER